MKRILMLASSVLLGSLVTLAHASPNHSNIDVIQFKLTNSCIECDLSGADIGLNHSNATLTRTNLSNILGNYINLSDSHLQHTNFSGAFLSGANFSRSDLTGANFDGAYVQYANFSGSHGANLETAHMCRTILADGSVVGDCN